MPRNALDILALDPAVLDNLKRQAFDARVREFGKELHCYVPPFSGVPYEIDAYQVKNERAFPSVSITGTACALQCDHCKGFLLQGMVPVNASNFPSKLQEMVDAGAKGVLVSGGADAKGRVPFTDVHFRALEEAKRKHDIVVAVHTGLTDATTLGKMKQAGVDVIMFDVIGARETIKNVCHLDASPDDYVKMVVTCKELGLLVAPHVVIGMDFGTIKGEIDALSSLVAVEPDKIVLVILMGAKGTPMENIVPPVSDVERVLLFARLSFPSTPVVLGCAKPRGAFKERIERFAVESGLNAVAYPIEETITKARELSLVPVFHEHCCSLPIKPGDHET